MSSLDLVPPAWASDSGGYDVTGEAPTSAVATLDRLDCLECGDANRLCDDCGACRVHCRCHSATEGERILQAAGLDPSTNVGMSNLNRARTRAMGEYEGDVDTVVLFQVTHAGRRHWFAFGGDASIVARILGVTSLDPGRWRWQHITDLEISEVIREIVKAKLRVAIVDREGWKCSDTEESTTQNPQRSTAASSTLAVAGGF